MQHKRNRLLDHKIGKMKENKTRLPASRSSSIGPEARFLFSTMAQHGQKVENEIYSSRWFQLKKYFFSELFFLTILNASK